MKRFAVHVFVACAAAALPVWAQQSTPPSQPPKTDRTTPSADSADARTPADNSSTQGAPPAATSALGMQASADDISLGPAADETAAAQMTPTRSLGRATPFSSKGTLRFGPLYLRAVEADEVYDQLTGRSANAPDVTQNTNATMMRASIGADHHFRRNTVTLQYP